MSETDSQNRKARHLTPGLPFSPKGNTLNTHIVPTIEHDFRGLHVSSLNIAEGSGVQHKNVLESVSKNQADLEQFGPVAFETRKGAALPQGGFAMATRIALLNEQQSTLVMTYMKNTEQVKAFKLALVKGFFEMAKQLTQPARALSPDEIVAQALQITTAKVEALKAEITAAIPKVAYVDCFVADTDLLKLRAVASRLSVGESALRDLLLAKKWIYRETATRWSEPKQAKVEVTRYSAYAEKKHLFQPVMNHEAPRFKGETMHTLKVTPAGASAIARLINHADEFAALTA